MWLFSHAGRRSVCFRVCGDHGISRVPAQVKYTVQNKRTNKTIRKTMYFFSRLLFTKRYRKLVNVLDVVQRREMKISLRVYGVSYGKKKLSLRRLGFAQPFSLLNTVFCYIVCVICLVLFACLRSKMAALIRRIINTTKAPAPIGPYRWEVEFHVSHVIAGHSWLLCMNSHAWKVFITY